jgi:hypothetical protein
MKAKYWETFFIVFAFFGVVVWYGVLALPPSGLTDEQKIRVYLRSGLFLDDAFYYFKTAKNYFEHGMVSFDLINTTNGFHPLWFLISIPLVAISSPVDLLATVTWVELSLYFGASVLIARAVAKHGWQSIAIVLIIMAAFSYNNSLRIVLNGLETSLHLFCLSACVLCLKRYFETGKSAMLLIFLPLLFLSRIEGILFSAIALCVIAYSEKKITRKMVWMAFVVALVFVVYVFVNYLYVGELFPVSGAAKRIYADSVHSQHSIEGSAWQIWMGYVFWVTGQPWLSLALCINAISVVAYFAKNERTGLILSTYCILKYIAYVVAYKSQAGSYLWYYAPDLLSAIYFLAWCLIRLPRPALSFFITGLFATLFFVNQAKIFKNDMQHHGNLVATNSQPQVGSELDMFYLAAKITNEMNLPNSTILGMHDSGIFGFFSNYRVVNMDGLINGSHRLQYIKKYAYNWIPYVDECQAIDGYINLISTSGLGQLEATLAVRGFISYPLQEDIEIMYGTTLIPREQSQIAFFYKGPAIAKGRSVNVTPKSSFF